MQNKEKTKPTKKKILLYYLILAASLLVIAAITVGIVFAVKANETPDITLEAPKEDDNKPNDQPGNTPDDGNDPVEDTSSKYEFITPVKDVVLRHTHNFDYNKTMDYYRMHRGMDFSAAEGTEVFACVDGVVTEIITNNDLYGAIIKISHAGGVDTVYKFVNPVSSLKVGSTVNRGDTIATVAKATGVEIAEGDHLHLEVFANNKSVDPDDYLKIVAK